MKILYLSPWFPAPLDTGSRTRVYYLARELAKYHDLILLSLDPQGWQAPEMDYVASFCQHCAIVPRDPFQRSPLRRATRFFAVKPIVTQPFHEMLDLVRDLHKKESFDLVISGTTIMADYALAISGAPRVLEEHNSMSRWLHERYKAQGSMFRQLRCRLSWEKSVKFERKLFRKFDLISMVSEDDAAYVRELLLEGDTAVQVFPNGVDKDQFRQGLAKSIPYRLIFSGSLTYSANLEAMRYFLDEIFPRIRKTW